MGLVNSLFMEKRLPNIWLKERLRELKDAGRNKNQSGLADLIGRDKNAVTYLINGRRQPQLTEIEIIADYLEMPIATVIQLFQGGAPAGHTHKYNSVPLRGQIMAGGRVEAMNKPVRFLPRPPGQDALGLVALRIVGDSMYPLRDGWTVYYTENQDGVAPDAVGNLSIVEIEGARYVKDLTEGSLPGLYTLRSWNAQPIENVRVIWAAPILHISCD